MAQPISKTKLIDFMDLDATEEEKDCHKEAFNSVLLKISDLEKYRAIKSFTHCQNNACQMILTEHVPHIFMKDSEYVMTWNIIEQNKHLIKGWAHQVEMEKNPYKYVLWNCRFCNHRNLVEKKSLFFAPNKTKEILRDGINQTILKNRKQNSEESKLVNDPLILFMIDTSSSMDETIEIDKEKQKGQNVKNFLQSLRKNTIYKKIKQKEEGQLEKIKKNYSDENSGKYEDLLNKAKLFMGLTEDVVKSICNKKDHSICPDRFKPKKKIGFMFFNSKIILQKISNNKKQVIEVEEQHFSSDKSSEKSVKTDFGNAKQLYNIGRNYGHQYGMDMKNFKFEQLEIDLTNTGQTALGPALFVAAGIVNNYGSGSIIVIVTDGQANKGVLSEEQKYEQELNFLRIQLERSRCESCLIQLKSKEKKEVDNSPIEKYYKQNHCQIFVDMEDKFQSFRTKLETLIEKVYNAKAWTNEIRAKSQHSAVDYQESITKIKSKLFSENYDYLTPSFKENKLKPQDYLYPFMTQIIVKYQNMETRQEEIFMSYMIQKFIKFKEMSNKDRESLVSQQTLENVIKYLSIEQNRLDFNDIPLSVIQQSFRKSIQRSMVMSVDRSSRRFMEEESILPNLWSNQEEEGRVSDDEEKL